MDFEAGALNLMRSYLLHRRQRVKIDGTNSDWRNVNSDWRTVRLGLAQDTGVGRVHYCSIIISQGGRGNFT